MPYRPPVHSPHRPRRDYREEAISRQQRPEQVDIDAIRHTMRWQKVRKYYLASYPLCADPYGVHQREQRIEAASQVDHVIPLASRPDLAYDWTNLQSLCVPCHARKSMQERRER